MVLVASDHRVPTGIGQRQAIDLAVRPDLRWQPLSAGDGAHGYRWYDWALIGIAAADPDQDEHGGHHALLIRRSRSRSDGELAFSTEPGPRSRSRCRRWSRSPAVAGP